VFGNYEATNLFVFTGKDRPEFVGDNSTPPDTTRWKPAAQGLEIIDDKAATLCNHDLALAGGVVDGEGVVFLAEGEAAVQVGECASGFEHGGCAGEYRVRVQRAGSSRGDVAAF
jgi:hypothetical protein